MKHESVLDLWYLTEWQRHKCNDKCAGAVHWMGDEFIGPGYTSWEH